MSVRYDSPRIEDMEYFIKHMEKIKESNPDLDITKRMVYRELQRAGIRRADLDRKRNLQCNENMFPQWTAGFKGRRNISVYVKDSWKSFCQFRKGFFPEKEFIKMYIPLNKDHLYDGVNLLFGFIETLGINHSSKVSNFVRSDNVIVRLRKDDWDSAMKIINFVNNNKYLREGLNRTNPFVPNINGIGIIRENGTSYNSLLAEQIANFVNYDYRNQKAGNKIQYTDQEFKEAIRDKKFNSFEPKSSLTNFYGYLQKNCHDREVMGPFITALGYKREEVVYSLTEEQKNVMIQDVLKDTYDKGGVLNVKKALMILFKFDSTIGFSKDQKETIDKLGVDSFKKFVYSYVISSRDDEKKRGVLGAVNLFCNNYFSETLAFTTDNNCMVTLAKYGDRQLRIALNRYLKESDYSCFAKNYDVTDKFNARREIIKMTPMGLEAGIKRSLAIKGIDTSKMNIDQLIECYSTKLSESLSVKIGTVHMASR